MGNKPSSIITTSSQDGVTQQHSAQNLNGSRDHLDSAKAVSGISQLQCCPTQEGASHVCPHGLKSTIKIGGIADLAIEEVVQGKAEYESKVRWNPEDFSRRFEGSTVDKVNCLPGIHGENSNADFRTVTYFKSFLVPSKNLPLTDVQNGRPQMKATCLQVGNDGPANVPSLPKPELISRRISESLCCRTAAPSTCFPSHSNTSANLNDDRSQFSSSLHVQEPGLLPSTTKKVVSRKPAIWLEGICGRPQPESSHNSNPTASSDPDTRSKRPRRLCEESTSSQIESSREFAFGRIYRSNYRPSKKARTSVASRTSAASTETESLFSGSSPQGFGKLKGKNSFTHLNFSEQGRAPCFSMGFQKRRRCDKTLKSSEPLKRRAKTQAVKPRWSEDYKIRKEDANRKLANLPPRLVKPGVFPAELFSAPPMLIPPPQTWKGRMRTRADNSTKGRLTAAAAKNSSSLTLKSKYTLASQRLGGGEPRIQVRMTPRWISEAKAKMKKEEMGRTIQGTFSSNCCPITCSVENQEDALKSSKRSSERVTKVPCSSVSSRPHPSSYQPLGKVDAEFLHYEQNEHLRVASSDAICKQKRYQPTPLSWRPQAVSRGRRVRQAAKSTTVSGFPKLKLTMRRRARWLFRMRGRTLKVSSKKRLDSSAIDPQGSKHHIHGMDYQTTILSRGNSSSSPPRTTNFTIEVDADMHRIPSSSSALESRGVSHVCTCNELTESQMHFFDKMSRDNVNAMQTGHTLQCKEGQCSSLQPCVGVTPTEGKIAFDVDMDVQGIQRFHLEHADVRHRSDPELELRNPGMKDTDPTWEVQLENLNIKDSDSGCELLQGFGAGENDLQNIRLGKSEDVEDKQYGRSNPSFNELKSRLKSEQVVKCFQRWKTFISEEKDRAIKSMKTVFSVHLVRLQEKRAGHSSEAMTPEGRFMFPTRAFEPQNAKEHASNTTPEQSSYLYDEPATNEIVTCFQLWKLFIRDKKARATKSFKSLFSVRLVKAQQPNHDPPQRTLTNGDMSILPSREAECLDAETMSNTSRDSGNQSVKDILLASRDPTVPLWTLKGEAQVPNDRHNPQGCGNPIAENQRRTRWSLKECSQGCDDATEGDNLETICSLEEVQGSNSILNYCSWPSPECLETFNRERTIDKSSSEKASKLSADLESKVEQSQRSLWDRCFALPKIPVIDSPVKHDVLFEYNIKPQPTSKVEQQEKPTQSSENSGPKAGCCSVCPATTCSIAARGDIKWQNAPRSPLEKTFKTKISGQAKTGSSQTFAKADQLPSASRKPCGCKRETKESGAFSKGTQRRTQKGLQVLVFDAKLDSKRQFQNLPTLQDGSSCKKDVLQRHLSDSQSCPKSPKRAKSKTRSTSSPGSQNSIQRKTGSSRNRPFPRTRKNLLKQPTFAEVGTNVVFSRDINGAPFLSERGPILRIKKRVSIPKLTPWWRP